MRAAAAVLALVAARRRLRRVEEGRHDDHVCGRARTAAALSSPPSTAARSAPKPTAALDPSKAYRITFETNCGSFTDRARDEDVAERRGLVRLARAQGVLRQDDLPPHRPRLHHPGRRPDRHRPGRARVHDARPAACLDALHARCRRDGEDAARAGRDERQPVLRRHGAGRRPAARLRRRSARSSSGLARRRPDRQARRPGDGAADAGGRDRARDRLASERRGGRAGRRRGVAVRQPEAERVPPGGARGTRRGGRVCRSSSSRAPMPWNQVQNQVRGLRGAVRGLGRGPGASLRCGLRALGRRGDPRARRARRRARARPARGRAPRRTARRGPVVAASYDGARSHPVVLARAVWETVPDEGARALEPRARRLLRPASRRATSTIRATV